MEGSPWNRPGGNSSDDEVIGCDVGPEGPSVHGDFDSWLCDPGSADVEVFPTGGEGSYVEVDFIPVVGGSSASGGASPSGGASSSSASGGASASSGAASSSASGSASAPPPPPVPDGGDGDPDSITVSLSNGGQLHWYRYNNTFAATCPNKTRHGRCRPTRKAMAPPTEKGIVAKPAQGRPLGHLTAWLWEHYKDQYQWEHMARQPDRVSRIAARVELRRLARDDPMFRLLLSKERDPRPGEPDEPWDNA
eukprot:1416448-Pyramimonas_sp.AAC.2